MIKGNVYYLILACYNMVGFIFYMLSLCLTMTLRSWKLRARISCISISKGVRLNSVGRALKGCSCTFFSFTPCRSSFISCTHRRAWEGRTHTHTPTHKQVERRENPSRQGPKTALWSSMHTCFVSPSLCVSVHPARLLNCLSVIPLM